MPVLVTFVADAFDRLVADTSAIGRVREFVMVGFLRVHVTHGGEASPTAALASRTEPSVVVVVHPERGQSPPRSHAPAVTYQEFRSWLAWVCGDASSRPAHENQRLHHRQG